MVYILHKVMMSEWCIMYVFREWYIVLHSRVLAVCCQKWQILLLYPWCNEICKQLCSERITFCRTALKWDGWINRAHTLESFAINTSNNSFWEHPSVPSPQVFGIKTVSVSHLSSSTVLTLQVPGCGSVEPLFPENNSSVGIHHSLIDWEQTGQFERVHPLQHVFCAL